jgi:hypothetical protein
MPFGISDLSAVYTAGGLYPVLDKAIVQIAMTPQVIRKAFQNWSLVGVKSNSISIPKQSGDRRKVVSRVAEGGLISMDFTPYTFQVATPYKVAEALGITKETIEDSMLPVLQDQVTRKALVVGNTIDVDGVLSLLANKTAVNATGKTRESTGTLVTTNPATTLGTFDLVNGQALLKQYNFLGNAMFVNPNVEAYIRILPYFMASNFYGGPPQLVEGKLAGAGGPEAIGRIMGLDVYVSNNIVDNPLGVGTINNRAIIASLGGQTFMGQYAPLGFYVEKRPVQTTNEQILNREVEATYISTRYCYMVTQPLAYMVFDALGTFVEGTAPLSYTTS